MSFSIRLKKVIKHADTNPTRFGAMLGYESSENIRKLMKTPNANPGLKVLGDIVRRFPEINARWLLTGDGDMLDPGPISNKPYLTEEGGINLIKELMEANKRIGALEKENEILQSQPRT